MDWTIGPAYTFLHARFSLSFLDSFWEGVFPKYPKWRFRWTGVESTMAICLFGFESLRLQSMSNLASLAYELIRSYSYSESGAFFFFCAYFNGCWLVTEMCVDRILAAQFAYIRLWTEICIIPSLLGDISLLPGCTNGCKAISLYQCPHACIL